jgi:hypothetical protein
MDREISNSELASEFDAPLRPFAEGDEHLTWRDPSSDWNVYLHVEARAQPDYYVVRGSWEIRPKQAGISIFRVDPFIALPWQSYGGLSALAGSIATPGESGSPEPTHSSGDLQVVTRALIPLSPGDHGRFAIKIIDSNAEIWLAERDFAIP